MDQFVVHTNQSILYSSSGMCSGLITGGGSGRRSILYNWLFPNRNYKQYIGIAISLVGCLCVKSTESLECGGNGRIILGGAVFGEETFCTGLLGRVRAYGVVPTAV